MNTYDMTNEVKWGKIREFKIETFQTVLIDELIPYVDGHFRTIAKPSFSFVKRNFEKFWVNLIFDLT